MHHGNFRCHFGTAISTTAFSVFFWVERRLLVMAAGGGGWRLCSSRARARSEARAGRLSLPKGRKLTLTFTAAADDYINRLDESAGKNITIKRGIYACT
jgi:hypothetical protein